MTPVWKEKAIAERGQASLQRSSEETLPPTELLVLLCDLPGILASRIQAHMSSHGRCRSLLSSQRRREQRFQDAVVQLIQELQCLQQSRPAGQVLVQVVVAHGGEPSLLEALVSVLKTAQQEYPKLRGQSAA